MIQLKLITKVFTLATVVNAIKFNKSKKNDNKKQNYLDKTLYNLN